MFFGQRRKQAKFWFKCARVRILPLLQSLLAQTALISEREKLELY